MTVESQNSVGLVIDYQINLELAPILPAVERQFEAATDTTSAQAITEHPHGGEWVATWLRVLQEIWDWETEHRTKQVQVMLDGLDEFQRRADEWTASGEKPDSPRGRLRPSPESPHHGDDRGEGVPLQDGQVRVLTALHTYYEMVHTWNDPVRDGVFDFSRRRSWVEMYRLDTYELVHDE